MSPIGAWILGAGIPASNLQGWHAPKQWFADLVDRYLYDPHRSPAGRVAHIRACPSSH